MKAFIPLTLLALLFVTSDSSQSTLTATSVTAQSNASSTVTPLPVSTVKSTLPTTSTTETIPPSTTLSPTSATNETSTIPSPTSPENETSTIPSPTSPKSETSTIPSPTSPKSETSTIPSPTSPKSETSTIPSPTSPKSETSTIPSPTSPKSETSTIPSPTSPKSETSTIPSPTSPKSETSTIPSPTSPKSETSTIPSPTSPKDETSTIPSPTSPKDETSTIPSPTSPKDETSTIPSPTSPKDETSTIPSPTSPKDETSTIPSPTSPKDETSTIPSPTSPKDETSTIPSPTSPKDETSTIPSPTSPKDETSTIPSPTSPKDETSTIPSPTSPKNETSTIPSPTSPKNETSTIPSPTSPKTESPTITPNASETSSETPTPPTPGRSTNPDPTGPTGLCQNRSCEGGSSCIALYNSWFCLCLEGYYYNASACMEGKIFPGIVQVTESDTAALGNKTSVAYENLHKKINKFGFSFPFAVPHNGPAGKDSSSYPGPTSNFASLDDIQYIEEGNINMFLLPGNPWTVSSAAHGGHYPNLLWFQDAFGNSLAKSDYGQTVINKVSTSSSARSGIRANEAVNVLVVNIFVQTTKYDETSVSEIITKALGDGASGIENYSKQDLCEYRGCKKNAGDDCSDGLQCECKDDLERPNLQVPFCLALASNCPDNCNEKNHKQCLQKDDGGVPECVCLPGYQDKEGTCEMCPFGYSGVDCKDQFQLILTIVGSVAGILILSMVIALVVLSRSRNKPKNIEEQNLIEDSFSSLKLQETGFTNSGADGHIFPKIKIAPSRDQPQNPYVNQRGW